MGPFLWMTAVGRAIQRHRKQHSSDAVRETGAIRRLLSSSCRNSETGPLKIWRFVPPFAARRLRLTRT
jgi:hypothetical protein